MDRGAHQVKAKELTMTDTQPVTTAIAAMIASGTTGQQIVAALVRRFVAALAAARSSVARGPCHLACGGHASW